VNELNALPAAVLVGHGSLLKESGVAMMAIAEQLRQRQITAIAEAGFLNFSQPTFAEAVAKASEQGVRRVIVLPYFLIQGHYVINELLALVRTVAGDHPRLHLSVADALGAHPALVKLSIKRLTAVDPAPAPGSGLLFVAHGTPVETANQPIRQVMAQVQKRMGYASALAGYLECNEPSIPQAIAQLVNDGIKRLTILPYFLHMGRHVRHDLPAIFAKARQDHPELDLRIAHHLDYDPLLVDVVAERFLENLMC
jgi:sirohydrochlorin cobaltochelatase